MAATAYIALGSNLGERQENLDRALQALQEQPGIVVNQVSSYYETEPVGGPPGQGKYLNAAAELQTDLEPVELMRTLLEVEKSLGRTRGEPNAPRTIDLDLLLYGDRVIDEPGLVVPHPRMHERLFVLQPLFEIAAQVVHPKLKCTVGYLLEHLDPQASPSGVVPADEAVRSDPIHRVGPHECGHYQPGRELAGLRALVTGSTSGIGRAIALELAAAGADIIIHGRRQTEAEAVQAEVKKAGVDSHILLAELREPGPRLQLVKSAWSAWDGLDIWINNAGADTLTGEARHWSFEEKLFELWLVDVRATVLLSREVGPRMKAAGGGVILNMGWDQAETGMEGDSGQLFGTVKGAIMAFTRSLAVTLAPEVRVNCLAPGWIRTAWGEQASAAWQERVRRETLLRRWGTPQDVARTARWLVSPAAAYITGQVIRINGGAVR